MTGVGLDDFPCPRAAAGGAIDPADPPVALADGITTADQRVLARRTFVGLPSQVAVARRWLAQLIDGFAAVDDVLLACSELAGNAVVHSDSGLPGGTFTVRLAIGQEFVRLEVLDQGGPWNCRRCGAGELSQPDQDTSQRGRGLDIVAAVTSAWGVAGDYDGRIVWCEIESE